MKFFLKLVGGILAVTISLGLVFDYQFFSVYLPRIIFYNNFHPVSAVGLSCGSDRFSKVTYPQSLRKDLWD